MSFLYYVKVVPAEKKTDISHVIYFKDNDEHSIPNVTVLCVFTILER